MSTPNVLGMLPGRVRFALYLAYGLAGVLYLALGAAYLTDPAWLEGAGRVLTALLVPFSALAATHVNAAPAEPELGTSLAEREAADPEDRD